MRKVIIDVDTGIDDSLAILLALESPEIDIVGFTTVSGNVEVNQATRNTLKTVQMTGKSVPVYKGCNLPLVKSYIDATDTHGADGLGETFYELLKYEPEEQYAVDFILQTIKENPDEITLIALGPLTNIAMAIQKDIKTLSLVKQIILMGGAARYHGNCSPVAEYNFWVDPHAAEIVFKSGLDITMVGLDVTHKIVLSPNIREIIKQFKTPLSQFIYDITQFYVDFHWKQERTIGCVINDPLVIAYLIRPDIISFNYGKVLIETEGIAVGQSVVDFSKKETNTKIVMDVDVKEFFNIFLKRLFPNNLEEISILLEKEFKRG
ncbi:nucleoside hydrolase [Cytobacillus sp. FJAT-54145]|uniref:Nucleoside hydrolase n=1 Tax=Cytobacillus spartinae TaxID=3299023 RepID=A0ABW6K6N6_9BACI